jgi:hypothetical protein
MSDEDRAIRDAKVAAKKVGGTGKKGRPRKQVL